MLQYTEPHQIFELNMNVRGFSARCRKLCKPLQLKPLWMNSFVWLGSFMQMFTSILSEKIQPPLRVVHMEQNIHNTHHSTWSEHFCLQRVEMWNRRALIFMCSREQAIWGAAAAASAAKSTTFSKIDYHVEQMARFRFGRPSAEHVWTGERRRQQHQQQQQKTWALEKHSAENYSQNIPLARDRRPL